VISQEITLILLSGQTKTINFAP